jgi:ribosomal-protein-alanine N-acetyltransferase
MSAARRGSEAALDLRPMELGDLDQVLEIETESFVEPWTRANFEEEIGGLGDSTLTVALLGEKVAGYSVTWYLPDHVHLANVAVRGDCRGRGIGRALVEDVIENAARGGVGKIMLEVRESNVEARRLYETLGFRAVGVKRNYYTKENEDAILMRYALEERGAGGVKD